MQQALDFISSVGDKKYNQELLDLAAIPSIASLPEHSGDIEKAARWLVKRLKSAGFEVGQAVTAGASMVIQVISTGALPTDNMLFAAQHHI